MQREFPTIDFATEAEVRSKAECRRTEEVTELLKDAFDGWTVRLPGLARPIFEALQPSHRPASAGK